MIRIVYDGDCPFCANYMRFAQLRRRVGEVELIDGRVAGDIVDAYAARGFEIDESFIVDTGDVVLTHGDALRFIHTNLAPRWTGLPYLTHPELLKRVYPSLRGIRNGTLKALGISPIRPAGKSLKAGPKAQKDCVQSVERTSSGSEPAERANKA